MKNLKKWSSLFLFIAIAVAGCKEEPLPEPEKEEAPELTQKINDFIETAMNDIYLWNEQVPDIDIRYEFDPEDYFEKLLYEEDRWSYITDDVEALEESFEGREKSFGYSLAFGTFSNTGTYFAIVEFVYPETPAANAGLKRGDIIMEIDNGDITDENYRDLLSADNLTITLGQLGENGISPKEGTVSMTSRKLELDPVLVKTVVEHEGSKIGYLFYAQYIANYNSSLDAAFQYFLEEQVTDLVIDLRYNPGGGTEAASYMCSSIAPLSVVNNKEQLITYQWNDKWQNIWQSENIRSQLEIPFTDTTTVKMGLNRVHFLTGSGTASASEFTITGLNPYMDVVTVGDTTFGKYTGSITVTPDFYFEEDYYEEFDNWGLQPIVVRYANSEGVTEFRDGFPPDISADDALLLGIPLGDKNDPLFAAAIENITGTPVIAMKKAKVEIPHTIFDRGFSKYDKNKRQMVLDHIQKDKFFK